MKDALRNRLDVFMIDGEKERERLRFSPLNNVYIRANDAAFTRQAPAGGGPHYHDLQTDMQYVGQC